MKREKARVRVESHQAQNESQRRRQRSLKESMSRVGQLRIFPQPLCTYPLTKYTEVANPKHEGHRLKKSYR
jgi:hypothetical protein